MTAFTTTPTLANLPASDSRSRVSEFMKSLQDEICQGLEEVDGQAKFIEDSWQRPEGGGGRSRVLREGAIFEQAGVNFSEVWGKELPPSIAKQRPEAAGHQFYATGTSMVLHPHNPYIPTVHLALLNRFATNIIPNIIPFLNAGVMNIFISIIVRKPEASAGFSLITKTV